MALETQFLITRPWLLVGTKRTKRTGPIPFKLFNWWGDDPAFKELVSSAWKKDHSSGIALKLRNLKLAIKKKFRFSKDTLGVRLKALSKEVAKIEDQREVDPSNVELWKALRLKQDELWCLWQKNFDQDKQKARLGWLGKGDCNSKLFHLSISARNRASRISIEFLSCCLMDDPSKIPVN